MRVIAGTAKGHPLVAPTGHGTRPTADRVREALFSSLQARLPDARVLDLYAGSGALAIEALSRGAAHATLVERDRRAVAAIRTNLDSTGVADRAVVVARDVRAALRTDPVAAGGFDLVLADPPYAIDRDELAEVLVAVADLVVPGGAVRLELGADAADVVWPQPFLAGRTRRYGDTRIHEAAVDESGPPPEQPAHPTDKDHL